MFNSSYIRIIKNTVGRKVFDNWGERGENKLIRYLKVTESERFK